MFGRSNFSFANRLWNCRSGGGGIFLTKKNDALNTNVNMAASQIPDTTWFDWAVANTNWQNPEQYMQGEGTEDEPYLVDSPEDLAVLCVNGAYDTDIVEGNYFLQTANLDMSAYEWVAIPYVYGTVYDGNGHTISGLISSSGTYNIDGREAYVGLGLFNNIDCSTIRNVNIKNSVFIAKNHSVGGICSTLPLGSDILNCSVDAYISVNATSSLTIGGIVCRSSEDDYINISDCTFTGTIAGSATGGGDIGGIIGNSYHGGDAHCNNCVFNGQILINGSSETSIGGIIGSVSNVADASLACCVVKGILKGSGTSRIGSLLGFYDYVMVSFSADDCAVYATIDNGNKISNVFVGGANSGPSVYTCSFVGTVLGETDSVNNVNCSDFDGCYAVYNGGKYIWSDDWTYLLDYYRLVPNMNDGLPIQTELYSIASILPRPEVEEVQQWFADFEWCGK